MMRIAAILCTAVLATGAAHAGESDLNGQVLAELNRLRQQPGAYAEALHDYRQNYRGNRIVVPGSGYDVITEEGVAPVDEAIGFLRQQASRQPFGSSGVLAAAASDHIADQGSVGSTGHLGSDGANPGERVRRRGGDIYVGEVITYGSTTAADIVRQLVVDDGVPDRGHRRLLFKGDLRFAGVSCGPHPVFRTMCVVDLASTADGRPPVRFASLR